MTRYKETLEEVLRGASDANIRFAVPRFWAA